MLIRDSDYFVRVIPFPRSVRVNGLLLVNDDGTYTICINANASADQRRAALRHELRHIPRGDIYAPDLAGAENLT